MQTVADNKKISELPVSAAPNDTDNLIIGIADVAKTLTMTLFRAFLLKIGVLDDAASVAAGDRLLLNVSGVARRVNWSVLKTDAQAGVQATDAELTAIAGLASAADRLPYFTGSGAASLAVFTSAGRALVDDSNAAAQRTTLGLSTVSQAEAEAGASTTARAFTAQRVSQAIAALETAVSVATQAQQESASSTTVYVSPGRQGFHPGAAKAWLQGEMVGTHSILASYNIASVTDEAVGRATITIATNFSGANYAAVGMTGRGVAENQAHILAGPNAVDPTAGALEIAGSDFAGALTDMEFYQVVFFGDQA